MSGSDSMDACDTAGRHHGLAGHATPGRAARSRLPLAVAVLLVGALVWSGCGFESGTRADVGSQAPDYRALTMDGEPVALADLLGEVVLLNIWATWCPPCRKEIPELQKLHESYADRGLRVVGVSVDAAGTDTMVRRFAADFGVSYDIFRDPAERASSVFAFQGIPGTLLIDRNGIILWRHLGPVTADDPRLLRALYEAL